MKTTTRKEKRVCEKCSKVFWTKREYIKKGGGRFCSCQCASKNRWEDRKIKRICKECGTIFSVKQSFVERGGGQFCSLTCAGKNKIGSGHPNWKGGITPIVTKIRNCEKYNQWRSDVFERDDWTCLTCRKKGVKLEAHHKKPFALIIQENDIKTFEQAQKCDELWNVKNGITLCIKCHKLTHKNTPLKMAGIGL